MKPKEALSKKASLIISILILVIFAFCIGYNLGNTRFLHKNLEEELKATGAMFEAQGNSPESIKKTLDLIRITRLKEIGGEKRELLAIWITSILIIINIFISLRKKK